MSKILFKFIRCFYIIGFLLTNLNLYGQTQVPRIEPSACPVEIPGGVKAECKILFVKENRAKTDSKTIKVPFIIIKSTAPNPAPDPILYTSGGPGASSLGRVRGAKNLTPFTKERDYIIFEQRGTLFAEPNLQCPEVDHALHKNWELNLNAKKARRNEVQAAKICRDRLIRDGVDLAAYTSAASAADIEDLRRGLGIKEINLYGISYSTRLMLNYIRSYPDRVRSVILDSVLPTSVNWDESDVDNVMNSLDFLVGNCASDAKCSATYPQLKEQLFAVIKAANKKPIRVDAVKDGKIFPIYFDGNMVFDFVYNLLEDNGALPTIPAIISALNKGSYEALKPMAESNLSNESFIWGMRYSVWCGEEMPFQHRRLINAQAAKYPEIRGFKVQGALPDICKVWNVPAADAIENLPVKSSIPALIFAGSYDPDTPPAWGKLVASWFPNSFFYEVKTATHGVNNNRCTFVDITASFIIDPANRPNDKCLANLPVIEFK
ncbi:MAG: alpha/beta hydrolase [Undibacterium sp.]|nr:alpha/beta hydrolase [Undibacterium sp.]